MLHVPCVAFHLGLAVCQSTYLQVYRLKRVKLKNVILHFCVINVNIYDINYWKDVVKNMEDFYSSFVM